MGDEIIRFIFLYYEIFYNNFQFLKLNFCQRINMDYLINNDIARWQKFHWIETDGFASRPYFKHWHMVQDTQVW